MSPRRQAGASLVALAALAIAAATLLPIDRAATRPFSLCLFCGESGLADFVRNVLLFAPFGIGSAMLGLGLRRTAALALALSAAVELAQLAIPGRDPGLSDLLANTVGAAVGAAAARHGARRGSLSANRAAASAAAAAGVAALALLASAWLLAPSLPATRWYGGWTPDMGPYERYHGRVLDAALGDLPVGVGPHADSAALRRRLAAGEPLRVRAVAGARPTGLAALFTIHDEEQREILLLGVAGDDLVLRTRTRAAALRFESPGLRIPGALRGIAPGEALDVSVSGGPQRRCVTVNGAAHCEVGFDVGSGSLLLAPGEPPSPRQRRTASLMWLAAHALPLGLWIPAAGPRTLPAFAVLLAAVIAAPQAAPVLPPAAEALGALALGAGLGALFGRAERARAQRDPSAPAPVSSAADLGEKRPVP